MKYITTVLFMIVCVDGFAMLTYNARNFNLIRGGLLAAKVADMLAAGAVYGIFNHSLSLLRKRG